MRYANPAFVFIVMARTLLLQVTADRKTLRITPAMAAGVTDKLWEIGDVVKMLEDWESQEKQAA